MTGEPGRLASGEASGHLSQPWRPLRPVDLPELMAISHEAHPSLPERVEVTGEKLSLFGAGAWAYAPDGRLRGYGLSFPWIEGRIPPLDTLFEALPPDADALFIHDVAITFAWRGRQAAAGFLTLARQVAAEHALARLALISVYGTDAFWSRHGFARAASPPGLTAYGAAAIYMTAGSAPLPG